MTVGDSIESLIIACLKTEHNKWALRGMLDNILKTEGLEKLVGELTEANHRLWNLCADKLAAANDYSKDAHDLRVLLRQDVELCRARAELRAEITRRLGDRTPDAASIKDYGEGKQ